MVLGGDTTAALLLRPGAGRVHGVAARTCLGRAVLLVALATLAGCSCAPVQACTTDLDCTRDALFCTGDPVCVPGPPPLFTGADTVALRCAPGRTPCGPAETCVEALRACVPCADPLSPSCLPDMDAGPPDAGRPGPLDAGDCASLPSGLACDELVECAGMDCNEQMALTSEGSTRLDGTPGRTLTVRALPGGYCAPSCDASRLNDTCMPCAVCSGEALVGRTRVAFPFTVASLTGVCRERCTPSRVDTGCPRPGYTCDLETSTCMEACTTDAACQIVAVGPAGLGSVLADLGEEHPAYCDRATGRCGTRGSVGARIGDPCFSDGDCTDGDGVCIVQWGDSSGICSRLGCRASGFECAATATCDVRHAGTDVSGCFVACNVGADDGTPGMIGARGGHLDCGEGRACSWNGVSEPGERLGGSCIVGEYNDIRFPNHGAPCLADSDCHSPFGLGTCLFRNTPLVSTGICSVRDCATFLDAAGAMVEGILPGVAVRTPICDPARGELCMNLAARSEPPSTYCLVSCASAESCAPGYACAELAAGGRAFCWPSCRADFECRADSRCLSAAGVSCDAADPYCVCVPESP